MKVWLSVVLVCALGSIQAQEVPTGSVESALKKGDYHEALEHFGSFEKLETWYEMFLYGTALLMAGDLDDAADVFDTAIGVEGNVAELWVQRAVVEQERGDGETALRLLKVALELEPGLPMALLNVGYAYESLGREDEARIAYSEYLRASSGKLAHISPRRSVIAKLAGSEP